MILFKQPDELKIQLANARNNGKKIGFVPTMGALHEGHLSLAKTCKAQNDITVVSIFVNPTQFNDKKDFDKYPRTIEKDIYLLEKQECDILFLPSPAAIYGKNQPEKASFDLGRIEQLLEGKFRPGHFQGVSQIVNILLEIIEPHHVYLGQKDYQQCMVIERLLKITGKDKSTKLVVMPTLRENDGLAMSSRNARLNDIERKRAPEIYQTLTSIKKQLGKKEFGVIKKEAVERLERAGFKVDYVEIADATTLETANQYDASQKLVALIAAFNGEVRLIDNILLN